MFRLLVLVAIGEAVVLRQLLLLLLEPNGVAEQKLAARRQAHEHVIVQIAIRNDVPEAEAETLGDFLERQLVALGVHAAIEPATVLQVGRGFSKLVDKSVRMSVFNYLPPDSTVYG